MTRRFTIGWGRQPRSIRLPRSTRVLVRRRSSHRDIVPSDLDATLRHPVGCQPFSELLNRVASIAILIPDETRFDVASLVLPKLLPMLEGKSVSIGIAAGKHPSQSSGLSHWCHDANAADLVFLGHTQRQTPVAYPDVVIRADLRILLGEIKPHYFAGYSGGAKTLFPGVAREDGIWKNHLLKAEANARLGQVSTNPCRLDMEEAAEMAGLSYIINVIRDIEDDVVHYISGHPVTAHRAGVELARHIYETEVIDKSETVIVSDRVPTTMNLYQACKLIPPAAQVLKPGGTLILCAECADGLGPTAVINEGIYRLGLRPLLPETHKIILISDLPEEAVRETFAEYSPSIEDALQKAGANNILLLPYAGDMIPVATL
ncbi:MAG: lactate racemase domain-containing protein [Myxococcota bacterium]|nr:lactate racemase domain-containing protein [Myxococcota bacterium]